MAKTTYSKAELTALIVETQKQVRDLLKSEDAALLAKEEEKKDGPPPKKDESKDSSSSSDSSESSGPPSDDKSSDGPPAPPADDSSSAAPPAGDSSAPPAPGADASAPPAPGADPASPSPAPASADPAAASPTGGDSVEALKAAYAQLTPESRKMHFLVLKDLCAADVAATASAAAPVAPAPAGAAPPAPAPAPAAPVAPPAAPPAAPGPDAASASAPLPPEASNPVTDELAMKNEKELNEKLAKSEAKISDLEKSLTSVTKAFELLMRKPERKAVRGKDVSLAKSEPVAVEVAKLSSTDLAKKLAEVAKNPELKKSDRDLINGYFNKRVKAADLQVLFDKK
jgi:hypothetical protein